ncbi:MAG: hypothetical protein HGB10_06245 [Coriobacteriia bacterium]|nr:hypothetical protein [Coriobacteriia bacterium]
MAEHGPRGDLGRIRERPYQRSGWDRERRLKTTIVVSAIVLLVVGVSAGFALGRATAPKPAPVTAQPTTTVVETLPAGVVEEIPTETVDATLTEETTDVVEVTEDTTAPPKPKQTAPANGAVLTSSRVTLRWTKVEDDSGEPVKYAFEIQDRRSNGTYGNTQIIKGLSANSYSARVLSVRRRWRVWAVDSAGNASKRSSWRTYIHKYVPPAKSNDSTPTKSDETT